MVQPIKEGPIAALTRTDLEATLRFLGEASDAPDQVSFRRGMLSGLHGLIDCDVIGYNEVDLERGTILVLHDPIGSLPDEVGAQLLLVASEHPVLTRNRAGDLRPYAISDFLSTRQFHRMALYQDFFRHLEAQDQIAFGLPGEAAIGIAMNRPTRGFSARDRELLELLRPHLTRAWERVRERERAAALIAGLELGLEQEASAVILLDSRLTIEHASELALHLLEAYGGARLGRTIDDWLEWVVRPDRLTVEGARGYLTVRALPRPGSPDALMLLLSERRREPMSHEQLLGLGVSRREAQVLRALARGLDNSAVASELGISVATVRKHLERIYSKLGVHTRTEAAAVALGSRPPRR